MADLAVAADLPWSYVPAPAQAHQSITMNCDLLASLLPFDPRESTAIDIVDQWQDVADPA